MAAHEQNGKSNDWYTPQYVFDAMEVTFDMDVAAAVGGANVPAHILITSDSLNKKWYGFIWMNPPWCKRGDKIKWINSFIELGYGVALMPDRTSAPWWQHFAKRSDAVLFVDGKIKFEKPDGSTGRSPSTGTTLFAIGKMGIKALERAEKNKLGIMFKRVMLNSGQNAQECDASKAEQRTGSRDNKIN